MLLALCLLTALTLLFWSWAAVMFWPALGRIPQLKRLRLPEDPDFEWPALTIVTTARNEEPAVGRAVRSMLAADYPRLEVVAVNDASSDGTGAILDGIRDLRLRVVHLKGDPPPGWLGKNWALHCAAQEASGEYILFTDGDVEYRPGALRRAIWLALRMRADHVVAFPRLILKNAIERSFMLEFSILFFLGFRLWEALDPHSRNSLGMGAFNLVRREALMRAGGFETIRMNVEDDVALGRIIKENGGRFAAGYSNGMVRVRWQDGAWAMVMGLEKNIYASTGFRAWHILSGAAFLLITGWMPFLAVLTGAFSAHIPLILLGLSCLVAMLYTIEAFRPGGLGAPAGAILAIPAGSCLLTAAMLNSLQATLRRGGIEWRGRYYSIEEIKAHRRDFPVF
ncbi:glycosyltransferase [Candidatus Sumerlaeota bacterium]|nr:glycosyltransferase [Candidatus Sumerlaeota bacterium]